MSIEPTEEQKQAAHAWLRAPIVTGACDDLARLLAELRDEVTRLEALCTEEARLIVERDTLRARVAELEAACGERLAKLGEAYEEAETGWLGDIKELEEREAQHLADIKAGRKAVAAWLDDPWLEGRRKLGEDFMSATAHYDDAKADAPAVDMQAWANGSCPEPGCSLANPHEQGAACVKPTAEGGEG